MRERRAQRRRDTIEEIVELAVAQMTEHGAGGLSLGAIARELGVATPSLYVYFPSKAALYDEIFARGWTQFDESVAGETDVDAGLEAVLMGWMDRAVAWALANPGYAQLMFWRPVPAWEPSGAAFVGAQRTLARGYAEFADAQRRGLVRADVEIDELVQAWGALVAGVISQQLSNEPGVGPAEGRTSRYSGALVAMFAAFYRKGKR